MRGIKTKSTGNAVDTQASNIGRKRFKKTTSRRKSMTSLQVSRIVDRKLAETFEKKFKDTVLTYNSTSGANWPSTSGWIVDLTNIAQDATTSGRIGGSIDTTSLEFSWVLVTPNVSAQAFVIMWRMIAVIWVDGTPPGLAEILADITAQNAIISPFRNDTKENRKILFDERVVLMDFPAQGTTGNPTARTDHNTSVGKIVIPLRKFRKKWGPVRYDVAVTTGQRHIYFVGVSNIPVASVASMWNFWGYSRVTYYDA